MVTGFSMNLSTLPVVTIHLMFQIDDSAISQNQILANANPIQSVSEIHLMFDDNPGGYLYPSGKLLWKSHKVAPPKL